jgi:hypothetical protein
MSRRSTIGTNPLDSVSDIVAPSGVLPPHRTERAHDASTFTINMASAAAVTSSGLFGWRRTIQVLGGSFGTGSVGLGRAPNGDVRIAMPSGDVITPVRDVVELRLLVEEVGRDPAHLAAWAVAGGLAAGLLGATAGAIYGGLKRRILTFEAVLQDGRRFHASCDPRSFDTLRGRLNFTQDGSI